MSSLLVFIFLAPLTHHLIIILHLNTLKGIRLVVFKSPMHLGFFTLKKLPHISDFKFNKSHNNEQLC